MINFILHKIVLLPKRRIFPISIVSPLICIGGHSSSINQLACEFLFLCHFLSVLHLRNTLALFLSILHESMLDCFLFTSWLSFLVYRLCLQMIAAVRINTDCLVFPASSLHVSVWKWCVGVCEYMCVHVHRCVVCMSVSLCYS